MTLIDHTHLFPGIRLSHQFCNARCFVKPQTLCGFIQQRHHLARVPGKRSAAQDEEGARFINIGKACSHTGKGTNPTGEGLLQILCFNIVLMSEAELTRHLIQHRQQLPIRFIEHRQLTNQLMINNAITACGVGRNRPRHNGFWVRVVLGHILQGYLGQNL